MSFKSATKVIILFLILTFTAGCYKNIEIGNIEAAGFGNTENSDVAVFIKIKNPNFYAITITNIDLQVFFNDKHIGDIKKDEKLKIPANSNQAVELPLDIDFQSILLNTFNFLKDINNDDNSWNVSGYMDVKVLFFKKQIFIDKNPNIEL